MPEIIETTPEQDSSEGKVALFLDLGAVEHELRFKDFQGTVHVFTHRMPTPEERSKLKALEFQIKKKGKSRQVVTPDDMRPAFHSLGLKLATGFKKGTLGFKGKLIASDSSDPEFKGNWRGLVDAIMPDVFTSIGVRAFRSGGEDKADGDFEEVSASLSDLVRSLGFDSLDDLMGDGTTAPVPTGTVIEETDGPLSSSSNV